MSFDDLEKRIREWQAKTFPRSTLRSVATHLLSETVEFADACGLSVADIVGEVNRTLNKISSRAPGVQRKELGDIFHLAIAGAEKMGATAFEVTDPVFVENLSRKWGTLQPSGIVEHVEDDD